MTVPVFLRGERVTLRPPDPEPREFFQRQVNDPEVWTALERCRPVTASQEREFLDGASGGDDLHLAIYAHDVPAGMVSIENVDTDWGVGELGFWVAPNEQGQGYGTEAVQLTVGYAFDHRRLERVSAHVLASNEASRRLLDGLGFTQEGVLRDHAFVDGERVDVVVYGVLADEWV